MIGFPFAPIASDEYLPTPSAGSTGPPLTLLSAQLMLLHAKTAR
jgi:hypothetical protein